MRVAVVGVGHLGRHHARVVREHPDAELVAVVDRDPQRARTVARELGVAAYPAPEELPDTLDAVIVAVPTPAHEAVAGPFLDRGLAVLVEKPLAADPEAAARLVARARAGGAVLQVGHVERFNPAVMAVLEMGIRPVYVEARRVSSFTPRAAQVGVVVDLMIHDLDIVLHLLGEAPARVEALGVGVLTDHEDMAQARLLFSSGAVADLSTSRLSLRAERRIRLFAPDAYVSLDYLAQEGVVYRVSPTLRRELAQGGLPPPKDFLSLFGSGRLERTELTMARHEPLAKQFEAFLRAARREAPPAVDGEAALAAVAVAHEVSRQVRRFLASLTGL